MQYSALDYIEKMDYESATEEGRRNVYYNTFLMILKAEIWNRTNSYEFKEHIYLFECIRKGFLTEVMELIDFKKAY